MILFLQRALLDQAIRHADDEAHQEAVGVFVEPAMAAAPPQYVRLRNAHYDPTHHFWVDYVNIETAIFEAFGGFIPGRITLFHSHLGEPDHPSIADISAAGVFEIGMRTHPFWAAARQHLVWGRRNQTWFAFDEHGWEHAL